MTAYVDNRESARARDEADRPAAPEVFARPAALAVRSFPFTGRSWRW